MGIIEAIKKGFGLANKVLNLVLLVFVFNLIWNLAGIPMGRMTPPPGGTIPIAVALISVLFILISILVQGGVLASVKDAIKTGTASLGKFISYGKKLYLRLLGLGLILILIIGILGLLSALIISLAAPSGSTILFIIALIGGIVIGGLGLYLVILLFPAPYVLVAEDVGVVKAIKGSISFVRGNLLRVLGLVVLLILISLGIGLVIGLIGGGLSLVIKGVASQILIGLLNSALNAYLSVLVTGAMMSFYLASGSGASAAAESSPAGQA